MDRPGYGSRRGIDKGAWDGESLVRSSGNAVQRLEDPTLLTGAGKYADDLTEPGMAHVVFARSPVAHGTITSIDVSAAEGMPGVVAVYRAERRPRPRAGAVPGLPDDAGRAQPAGVRQGHACASSATSSRPSSPRPASRRSTPPRPCVVEYDPLPAVTTAAAALAPDAPILFPEHGSNVCFATTFGDDVDALEGAEAVAEVTMVSQRLAGVPMECNAILAVPGEPDGGLTCWVSHQAPHGAHAAMAPILGLEPEQLRIVCPWVGGGFGPKAAVYVEYLVAAAAARALGRPVKWTETRSEDMVSLVHGRDYVMTAKLGTDARRHDRRARRQGRRVRRRLPGDRGDPADAHPDDVARRLRRAEGPLRRR